MCGIIALFSFKNHDLNLSKLDEMADNVKHRGPDGEGYALFSLETENLKLFYGNDTPRNVITSNTNYTPKERYQKISSQRYQTALAHRRLSIIDLSPSGHQPMCDDSKRYWIVYNGEIYNFKDIREELKQLGYSFFSPSDTEVALKSYIAWGKECQNKFNGMWAIVIWDNIEKTFWISRDRFGVKPLYYMFHDNFFIVCSEIKSILPLLNIAPNFKEILAYILDGQSEAQPETFFDNVYRFPNGHSSLYYVRSGDRNLVFERYWDLGVPSNEKSFSKRRLYEYSEHYNDLLDDAVKIRLYADVNVGCALSGGLDSASICYLANKYKTINGHSDKLTTFSNIYKLEDEQYCDESQHIGKLVRYLGVKPIYSSLQREDILQLNDKGIWYAENCYEDLSVVALNTYSICKDHNITVALDGQGADEQLCGYQRFWYNYFYSRQKTRLEYWKSFVKGIKPKKELIDIPLKELIRFSFFGKIAKKREPKNNRFPADENNEYIEYRKKRNIIRYNDYFLTLNEIAQLTVKSNLQKQLRNMDISSMAYSVESRQPFMDYRLIKFLNDLPDAYKMYNGWTKYISRVAFDNKLPKEIVWRKDKMGWPTPYKVWIQGNILDNMVKSIEKSAIIGKFVTCKDFLRSLNQTNKPSGMELRILMRLYNVSRFEDIFINRCAVHR